MSGGFAARAVLLVFVVIGVVVADAASGGWDTVNWLVVLPMVSIGLVVIAVTTWRRS